MTRRDIPHQSDINRRIRLLMHPPPTVWARVVAWVSAFRMNIAGGRFR